MKNEHLKEYLFACKDEVTKSRINLDKIMDDCWQIYRNQQDYSDKEDWQAKTCTPDGQAAINKAQGIFRAALTKPSEFFALEGGTNKYHMQKRMQNLLSHPEVNFVDHVVEAVGSSLVFGVGILKCGYKIASKTFLEAGTREIDGKEMFNQATGENVMIPQFEGDIQPVQKDVFLPHFEVLDPRTTFFPLDDPDAFVIEEMMVDLSKVLTWAENSDSYNKNMIARLRRTDYSESASIEVSKRLSDLGIIESNNKFRKQVLIQRYYGDVTDENGKIVHENAMFELANGEYLIRPPQPLPYWHGKKPHVIFSPIRVLMRKTGMSMLEGVISIQRAMNNITNLQLDALVYELLGVPLIDTSRLVDPLEAMSLTPGYPLRVKDMALGSPVVIDRPSPGSGFGLHVLERMRRDFQNGTGITDILQGLNTVKGENATATEINRKGSESMQHFQTIGQDIECQGIVPALERTCWNILQYDDFADVVDPELAQYAAMPRFQRVQRLKGPYSFRSRGITSYFEKRETLMKMLELLNPVSRIPIAAMAVKWSKYLRDLFELSLADDGLELVYSEEEVQKMQQDQSKQQMQMQQQQMKMQIDSEERDRKIDLVLKQLEGIQNLQAIKAKGDESVRKEIVKGRMQALQPVRGQK